MRIISLPSKDGLEGRNVKEMSLPVVFMLFVLLQDVNVCFAAKAGSLKIDTLDGINK